MTMPAGYGQLKNGLEFEQACSFHQVQTKDE